MPAFCIPRARVDAVEWKGSAAVLRKYPVWFTIGVSSGLIARDGPENLRLMTPGGPVVVVPGEFVARNAGGAIYRQGDL